jgi:hypothetical protein
MVGSVKVPIAELPEQLEKSTGRSEKPLKFGLPEGIIHTDDAPEILQ